MAQQQSTVADIFRRAQSLRQENPDWSYKQIQEQLVKTFSGGPFPPLHNLTIPEQDARARMAAQATREKRLEIADIVIDNDVPLDDLRQRVRDVWDDLVRRARASRASQE